MKVYCQWLPELDAEGSARVLGLYNAVLQDEDILGYPEPLFGKQARAVIEDLASAVRMGRYEFLAIMDGEKMIGMALLEPNQMPNCRHLATLSKGIIHPAHRARTALKVGLLAVVDRCLQRGVERLLLDVRENSRSHLLWASLGFQPYGRLQDYSRLSTGTFAGLYMEVETSQLLRTLQQGRIRERVGVSGHPSDP